MKDRYDRPWTRGEWAEFFLTILGALIVCILLALFFPGCVVPVPPTHPPQPSPRTTQVRARFVTADGQVSPFDPELLELQFDEGLPSLPCVYDGNTGTVACEVPPGTPIPFGAHLDAQFPTFVPVTLDVTLKVQPDFATWQLVPGPNASPDIGNPRPMVLVPTVKPLPVPPSKRELMEAQYTFQGLRANCQQYDPRPIPIFDPMLDVVDGACRQAILDTHRAAGDTVIGVALSHQYAEPGLIPVLTWGHDWTTDLPGLHAYLLDLIRQGWYIQLHLAGDGHSVKTPGGRYTYNDPVGWTYGCEWLTEKWPGIADALDDLHRYIRFLPGYDGVFYGCEDDGLPVKIPAFARQFKQRWPDGVLGIEFNVGHLPFGEGDDDWQPTGRMRDFDMVFAEFDGDINQDSTWQIVARLMKQKGQYHRPPEQPAGDDPNPPAYLGKWPGVAVCFEWDTYDDVRFKATPQSVDAKRQKLRAMGCPFTG